MKKDFYGQTVDFMLKKIPLVIYNNFISAVRQDIRLTAFDEEIYDYYEQVIKYFKKTIKIYYNNTDKIKSKAIHKLLTGLISVLNSRVSVFEETLGKYEHFNLIGENVNPIYVEKRNVVELTKMDIRDKLAKISDKFAQKLKKECEQGIEFEKIVQFYDMELMGEIIKLNDTIVKFYINLINDAQRRTAVDDFYELLKDEAQVLGSVIKVQANELERTNQTADEENVIQMILLQLREAYQYASSYVDNIASKFNSVEGSGNFTYHCDMSKFNIDREELKCFFDKNINIDKENINEMFFDVHKLTNNVLGAFGNIISFDKDIANADGNIAEIINGINETIKIKMENIEESMTNLEQYIDTTIDEVEKEINLYYRQTLLFELTTFEEIMNYSVSKLRNSENENVKKYVALIDEQMEKISFFLAEDGIEDINPKPKEMFNGREHDVLMAEKAEDFNKGEIIKVITRGYKKDNVVFIRASVIAAK